MRILVTGATGLIGKKVCRELARRKHELVVVSRDPKRASAKLGLPVIGYEWDATAESFPSLALDRVEAIVHLAGEPIADRRWTAAVKEKIVKSRTDGTATIAAALAERPVGQRPKVFVAASAIGFYGDRPGDEWLNESAGRGQGFLADTCDLWEVATTRAGAFCGRTAILRFGLVLSRDGGMLQRMIPPFRAGLGVVFGKGQNWMSWIHIRDLVRLICDAVEKDVYSGIFNAVGPRPVRQSEFAKELSHALGRKRVWKLPGAPLKLVLGDMSELMLGSQRVKAEHAQAVGFKFEYEQIGPALAEITAPEIQAG